MRSHSIANSIAIIVVSTILFTACNPSVAEEKREVAKSFAEYRDDVFYKKGNEAWAHLSKSTINYYSGVLNYIRVADSAQIDSFNLVTKLCVLGPRRLLRKNEILQLDPEKLFIFYINNDLMGDEKFLHFKASYIKIQGQSANAMLLDSAGRIVSPIDFAKENGKWKVDFVRMYVRMSQKMSRLVMEEYGKSENEFVYLTLQALDGPTPINKVWEPVTD